MTFITNIYQVVHSFDQNIYYKLFFLKKGHFYSSRPKGGRMRTRYFLLTIFDLIDKKTQQHDFWNKYLSSSI